MKATHWLRWRCALCRGTRVIRDFAQQDGMSVQLVEQNVRTALRIADRAHFMRAGEIIVEEPADVALARESWWDLF